MLLCKDKPMWGAKGALPMAEEKGDPAKPALTKRVTVVDKIEDQRKPEDFIGYHNRGNR